MFGLRPLGLGILPLLSVLTFSSALTAPTWAQPMPGIILVDDAAATKPPIPVPDDASSMNYDASSGSLGHRRHNWSASRSRSQSPACASQYRPFALFISFMPPSFSMLFPPGSLFLSCKSLARTRACPDHGTPIPGLS